jgi:hypothetical protein
MLRYYLGSEGEIIQPTTQAFPFSVVQGASVGTLVTIPYERKSRRLGDDE